MKTKKSFEIKALLPSFILEGSFSDHEIAPNDITIIKTSKYAKKPNHEQVFFDSHFLDQNISCSELNDESISSNSNDTNEEEDVPNSINYFFDSKKLNDSTLFQKISFFEKDQKLWNQFGNNKINMNVCFKDGNDDKIINPNTIKDINDENCLPHLKSKEDMDNGYKGTLNDFTQNFNNININNAFKNKNNIKLNGSLELSQKNNKLNNNGIKNNSNYKILNNNISSINNQNSFGLNLINLNYYKSTKQKEEEKNNDNENMNIGNNIYSNIKEEVDFIKFIKFCQELDEPLFNYICSKEGSKKIANLLNKYDELKANYLIQSLYMNFERIICNKYGNYFFQRLYLISQKDSRIKILNIMNNYFIDVSKNKIGICAIQNIIRVMESFEERIQIINYLKGYELEMSLDKEGTHLIQSIIDYFPEKERQNITDVLCTMSNIKILITNINGIHIIKRFIERNKIEYNRNKLIEALYLNINIILNNSKGCYILFYLMKKWGINSGIIFINVLFSNLEYYVNKDQTVVLIKKLIYICLRNCKLYLRYCNGNVYVVYNSSEFIFLRNLKILFSKINNPALINKLKLDYIIPNENVFHNISGKTIENNVDNIGYFFINYSST